MDPIIGGALIGGAASLISGIFGSKSSASSIKDSNAENREAAREQMRFQERMSNTSHQREVKDLRAAGLNPILSAHSGATTPSGASYVAQPAAPHRGELAISMAKTASEIALAGQMAKTEQSKQILNLANSAKAAEQTDLIKFGNIIRQGIMNVAAWSGRAAEKFTRPPSLWIDDKGKLPLYGKTNPYMSAKVPNIGG